MNDNTKKKIEIFPYNPCWPEIFAVEAVKIKEALGKHCLEIHHIGSTSIPNMAAKQDIDILLIVDHLNNALKLQDINYIFRGEINIPLRYYFKKNTEFAKVNLHACEADHGFIKLNLTFRDFLRANDKEAREYQELKYQIIKSPDAHSKVGEMISVYGTRKNSFIKSILKKAGYNDFMINFCIHQEEWDKYHQIKEEMLFQPKGVKYDKNYPAINSKNDYHFCMYKGFDIVAIAHVCLLPNNQAKVKSCIADKLFENQDLETRLQNFIVKWLGHADI
ncbi:MAG: GrpB family protein [Rickettsiaceae bacterium]|nr:GrpB family protein [Rickettsiaceae bacterium]